MKKLVLCLLCVLGAAPAFAQKDCEELKAAIAAKVEGKGVAGYTLEIIAKSEKAKGRVVGSCELGTKKIVYRRTP